MSCACRVRLDSVIRQARMLDLPLPAEVGGYLPHARALPHAEGAARVAVAALHAVACVMLQLAVVVGGQRVS